ncbi:hypothetical protein, partial [Desulfogranum marinum]|uniref:hypothetical protein n=1 Tax=Desulfogranum marinum TaxID=453220 RepID=UPI001963589D
MKRSRRSSADGTKASSDDQAMQSKSTAAEKQPAGKKMPVPWGEPVMDYQLFADAHSDLICGWFPDTTLFFVNTSYCLFFGKSRH